VLSTDDRQLLITLGVQLEVQRNGQLGVMQHVARICLRRLKLVDSTAESDMQIRVGQFNPSTQRNDVAYHIIGLMNIQRIRLTFSWLSVGSTTA